MSRHYAARSKKRFDTTCLLLTPYWILLMASLSGSDR